MNKYDVMADLLENGTDEEIEDYLLMEAAEEDLIIRMGGDRTKMQYAILIEQLLDDNNFYVFNGWEDAIMVSAPNVEKYVVTVNLQLPNEFDAAPLAILKRKIGALGVKGLKKLKTTIVFQLTVPKTALDEIEEENKKLVEEMI